MRNNISRPSFVQNGTQIMEKIKIGEVDYSEKDHLKQYVCVVANSRQG